MQAEFTICADCGETSIWSGAFVFALLIAACVALGYGAQRLGDLAGRSFRRTATVVTIAVFVFAVVVLWLSESVFAVPPCLAVLVGLFHRKQPRMFLFHGRG